MSKKTIVILSITIIAVVIVGLYQTFAIDSTVNQTDSNIYDITLINGSSVTVPAKSSKIVYYQVCNTNKGKVQYSVGYTSNNIIVKSYWDTIDSYTGYIDYGENKFIKLKLINDSEEDDTVVLNTVLGYENGGDLIPPSNVTLISKQIAEKNVIATESTITSSTSAFLGSTVSRSSISTVSFETDNIVPTDAASKDISVNGDGSVMMWYIENGDGTYELHIGSENGKVSIENGSYLFAYMDNVEVLDFSNVDLSGLTSTAYMFSGSSSLKEIKFGDNEISNVTNMNSMFYICKSLTSLNLSRFNTSNVTTMASMFRGCSSLTSLDVSNFDTSSVTDMSYMFANTSSLEILDLSNFDTLNVTTMAYMFNGCQSETIDLSSFDTSNVTNMSRMFMDCSKVKSLDLSNFDTSKISGEWTMQQIFRGCTALESLDISKFNTSKITSFAEWFMNCNNLKSLDLSSFDTTNVTKMTSMFQYCYALETIDFRNADFSNVTSYSLMFSSAPTDSTIYVKDSTQQEWLTSKFTTLTGVTIAPTVPTIS